MDTKEFIAIIAAVLLANAISAGFAISLYNADKDLKRVTFPMWAALFIAPLIVMGAAKFLLT